MGCETPLFCRKLGVKIHVLGSEGAKKNSPFGNFEDFWQKIYRKSGFGGIYQLHQSNNMSNSALTDKAPSKILLTFLLDNKRCLKSHSNPFSKATERSRYLEKVVFITKISFWAGLEVGWDYWPNRNQKRWLAKSSRPSIVKSGLTFRKSVSFFMMLRCERRCTKLWILLRRIFMKCDKNRL